MLSLSKEQGEVRKSNLSIQMTSEFYSAGDGVHKRFEKKAESYRGYQILNSMLYKDFYEILSDTTNACRMQIRV